MFESRSVKSLLTVAAFLIAPAAMAADETVVRKKVELRHVVVSADENVQIGTGDSHGVFVKRIQVGDGVPTAHLQVLGAGAEAIDISGLEVGDSRSFEVGDGSWAELTRTAEGTTLEIDGNIIKLPGLGAGPDGHFGATFDWTGNTAGEHDAKVIMLKGENMLHAGHPMVIHAGGDDAQSFSWTSADGTTTDMQANVLVIGEDGQAMSGDHEMVFQTLAGGLHGLPGLHMLGQDRDFSKLESLQGLDADVKKKVLAALQEILNQPKMMIQLDLEVDQDGDATLPEAASRVRRVQ
jgi:hypothetical protein